MLQPVALPSRQMLEQIHSKEYLDAFLAGSLPPEAVRRIGFRGAVHDPVLINRTLWEVASVFLPIARMLS